MLERRVAPLALLVVVEAEILVLLQLLVIPPEVGVVVPVVAHAVAAVVEQVLTIRRVPQVVAEDAPV